MKKIMAIPTMFLLLLVAACNNTSDTEQTTTDSLRIADSISRSMNPNNTLNGDTASFNNMNNNNNGGNMGDTSRNRMDTSSRNRRDSTK
jgi:hypothetical protein